MEFGFDLPASGPLATPKGLITLARRGEEMGFGVISASDHIVIPRTIDSDYPYSEDSEWQGEDSGEYLEMLSLLSFIAGQTSTAKLLTSVMVLPHRSPVLTAKILATIDVLSGGRLIVGCGVGWMREEFEAIGAPPFDQRGTVSDEYIRVFKELWTSDNPTFDGKYSRFSGISFLPKPVRKPHPPIWIGGESPRALRRAGRLGDAWYPIGNNPRFPVGTPEQLAEGMSRVRRYAEEADRDPATIDLAYSAGWYSLHDEQTLPDGGRRMLTGSPEQIAGDIKTLEGIGVSYLMLGFMADTLEETLAGMERFATEVKPLV